MIHVRPSHYLFMRNVIVCSTCGNKVAPNIKGRQHAASTGQLRCDNFAMLPVDGGLKASIHQATLLLATVVTRLYQPCSRVVAPLLQPGYNCGKQQSCLVYRGL